MRPPPRIVRRVVLGPAVVLLTVLLLVTLPGWLVVGAALRYRVTGATEERIATAYRASADYLRERVAGRA